MSQYTPTKLDEALELEIKAMGLRIEYMVGISCQRIAKDFEREMAHLISVRNPEYIRYLEQQRGLV